MQDPTADLVSWLATSKPSLYGALLVLAVLHRWLSTLVGRRKRPVEGERFYKLWTLLGVVSGAAWADAPVSVKTILGPMPTGRITFEGGFRSGDTDPRISGNFQRLSGPHPKISGPAEAVPPTVPPQGSGIVGCVLLVGFLTAFSSGCMTSSIDKARVEYARALKATTAIQSRWKLQNKEYQRKNIERIGVHTPAAFAWQREWVVKKAPVEETIRRCQAILDEGSDYLLLADDKRGLASAQSATACAAAMKDQIGKLLDGGL